jgi:hypothetical protein
VKVGSEGCATSPPGDLYHPYSSPTLRASPVNQEDVMSPIRVRRSAEFLFFTATDVLFRARVADYLTPPARNRRAMFRFQMDAVGATSFV